VSVYPCSSCKQRRPGKLASAYWAWFMADGNRSAWKSRVCASCAPDCYRLLLQPSVAEGSTDVFACISCGQSTSADSDPIYVTLYLPKMEPQEYALQMDGACAAKARIEIQTWSERLPDRGGVVGGPPHDDTVWAAFH
jgi:hypothetical protein